MHNAYNLLLVDYSCPLPLPLLFKKSTIKGPYIWGDEDDDDSDDDKDVDELNDLVIGVLQPSSETHSDDDSVWADLVEKIVKANQLDTERRRESKERHLQEAKSKLEEELAKAKLEEKSNEHDKDEGGSSNKQHKVDEETKRVLMQRYGYEEPTEDENEQGTGSGGGKCSGNGLGPGVTTNRDVAAAAQAEKNKELRNQNKTSKAEERKKTKEQKANKERLKEERRKKSQKGERKR